MTSKFELRYVYALQPLGGRKFFDNPISQTLVSWQYGLQAMAQSGRLDKKMDDALGRPIHWNILDVITHNNNFELSMRLSEVCIATFQFLLQYSCCFICQSSTF